MDIIVDVENQENKPLCSLRLLCALCVTKIVAKSTAKNAKPFASYRKVRKERTFA